MVNDAFALIVLDRGPRFAALGMLPFDHAPAEAPGGDPCAVRPSGDSESGSASS